jgi:hypothetical protein
VTISRETATKMATYLAPIMSGWPYIIGMINEGASPTPAQIAAPMKADGPPPAAVRRFLRRRKGSKGGRPPRSPIEKRSAKWLTAEKLIEAVRLIQAKEGGYLADAFRGYAEQIGIDDDSVGPMYYRALTTARKARAESNTMLDGAVMLLHEDVQKIFLERYSIPSEP